MAAAALYFASFADASLLPGHNHGHGHGHGHGHEHGVEPRTGRQQQQGESTSIDFSRAYDDPDTGLKCVDKEAVVKTQEREKLLECVHSRINVCHYTYVTKFTSQRQEDCKDNYEKICSISFKKAAEENIVQKCYRPMVQRCDDGIPAPAVLDPEADDVICKTVYESECSTRYCIDFSKPFAKLDVLLFRLQLEIFLTNEFIL